MEPVEPSLDARLSALEGAVRRLESRVSTLAAGRPVPAATGRSVNAASAEQEVEALAVSARAGISGTLSAAALLFVVLLFALVLRLGSESGWIPAAYGPAVGIGYCVLLLAASVGLYGRNPMMGRLLAATAMASCALVVVETYHRRGTLGLTAALVLLLVLALTSALLGRFMMSAKVATLGLVGGCVVASFLDLHATPLRGLAVGLAAAHTASAWLSWRAPRPWGRARWLLAANALVLTWIWGAKLANVPGEGTLAWAGVSTALLWFPWLAAAAWKSMRPPLALDAFEWVTPTLLTVLPFVAFTRSEQSVALASVVAAAMLAVGVLHVRMEQWATRGAEAFVAGGFGLGVFAWPAWVGLGTWSGFAVSLVAYMVFRRTLGKAQAGSVGALTHIAQLASTCALAWAGLLFTPTPRAMVMVGAVCIGATTWLHYTGGRQRSIDDGKDGPTVSLAALATLLACAMALQGALQGLAGLVLGADGPLFQAAQSLCAALLTAAAALVAWRRGWRDLAGACVAASALVAAKVLVFDLMTLPGTYVLLPVLAVAMLLGVTSVAFRGTAPATRVAQEPIT